MIQSPYVFLVGESYTRNDVYEVVGVSEDLRGGDWDTGYHRHEDAFFIFANVGIAGQTGHDYANRFEGDRLVWYGKTGARLGHASIQALLELGRQDARGGSTSSTGSRRGGLSSTQAWAGLLT